MLDSECANKLACIHERTHAPERTPPPILARKAESKNGKAVAWALRRRALVEQMRLLPTLRTSARTQQKKTSPPERSERRKKREETGDYPDSRETCVDAGAGNPLTRRARGNASASPPGKGHTK
ncbi:hypothetical protein MRX96_046158 [Rhipicephalus microplus]